MSDIKKNIHVFPNKVSTGMAAGKAIETCILKLQRVKNNIKIIFAAAPSQDYMLNYLTKSTAIHWDKITAYNMDEYIGLAPNASELFSTYLEKHLFSKVKVKNKITIMPGNGVHSELEKYSELLSKDAIDIICLGIGENGHIAFNDPPVANFSDPEIIKVVTLDHACRIQQVNDGCFKTLEAVPKSAITLTIPTLLSGDNLFCVVTGNKKSDAVKNTFSGSISTSCPASILTTHHNCEFYFDDKAYSKVLNLEKI